MNVLAFDTCLGAVSVAVGWRRDGGDWTAHHAFEARTAGHAERLPPMIAEVMATAGISFADLARIVVTVGPGTFTGVRTGVAAARALSLASGVPVAGVSSLAAIAAAARARLAAEGGTAPPLAVAVDARRGDVYWQRFAGTEGGAADGPAILGVADALKQALAMPPGAVVVGSGAGLLRDAAASNGRSLDIRLGSIEPDARVLLEGAADLPLLDCVTPLYLRAPDAKPQTGKSLPRA